MKKFTVATFLLIFLFSGLSSGAQNPDSHFSEFAKRFTTEKTHIHYDKATYYPGETIWFKAYLMEGIYPVAQTKTFYIDWIGDNGQVLWHTVSPVIEGSANGQFDIPEDYNGAYVHVKAYTRWMLNYDTGFLYSKDIVILPKNTASKQGTKQVPKTSLQFFPEGGDLVGGVLNRVAFLAADPWGMPVKVRGVLQDNKGTIVDSFRSVHDGMGSISFLPKEGSTYIAKWKDAKGTETVTELPAVKTSGIAMQVTTAGNKKTITLQGSRTLPPNLKQVHLLGMINGAQAFKTDVVLQEGNSARRIIPTENIPSGIMTITLFDAEWNAVAERVSFINNRDYIFQPAFEVQRWGLNKRARNEIKITVPDSLAGANLSVAVTDIAIDKDTSENIFSRLLLTGDIKGYVHNAAYYFSNNSDSTAQQLDLVMLTHGWRRFKWEDIARGKFPDINYPKDTSYLALSGKIFGAAKSLLSGNETLFLFIKERDSSLKPALMPIARDGSFSDPNLIFFDTLRVYYQIKSKSFSTAEARFMTERLPAFNYLAASKNFATKNPFQTDTSGFYRHSQMAAEALRLQNANKGKVLEAVTVTARTKSPKQLLDEKYARGMFSGGDGYQFDLVNDPSSLGQLNIFNYLQGKVAGLQITTSTGTPGLSWRGATPQLYLDEMPVDADFINSMPVSDVAYIKVFRPPFMGGTGGGTGGAIAIYTRKGSDIQSKPGGLNSNTVAGYTPMREFFSPNYASFNKQNEQRDIRTTLYWNPMIITTAANRSVVLSFYNNDVTKAFRVVIEGMTKEGLLAHVEEIME